MMDWNSLTLSMLALFGFLGLFVMLTIALFRRLPDLINEWRKVRRAWRKLKRDQS